MVTGALVLHVVMARATCRWGGGGGGGWGAGRGGGQLWRQEQDGAEWQLQRADENLWQKGKENEWGFWAIPDSKFATWENPLKTSKPGRAYRRIAGGSTGVASFNGDLLIGYFWNGFTLSGQMDTGGEGACWLGRVLAFTRYCHHQYCMVYGIQREDRWRDVYCAMGVQ